MTVAKVIVTNAVKEARLSDSSLSVTGNPQDLNWELQVKPSRILFLTFICCRYGQHNGCWMYLHEVEQSKHGVWELLGNGEKNEGEEQNKEHQGQDSSIAVLNTRRRRC